MRFLRPARRTFILDASAGITILTHADKEETVAIPSTLDIENPLSQEKRDILTRFSAATQGKNAID
ncbi:MAG: hypothetical protein ABJQ34_09350 [Paracoccaceae bacterium]